MQFCTITELENYGIQNIECRQERKTRKLMKPQCLQDQFDKVEDLHKKQKLKESKQNFINIDQTVNNSSLRNIYTSSRRILRCSKRNLSKMMSSIHDIFNTMFTKIRSCGRRHQRPEEQLPDPGKLQTPQTRSRQLLGRTPTRLYSPFGIESISSHVLINGQDIRSSRLPDVYPHLRNLEHHVDH